MSLFEPFFINDTVNSFLNTIEKKDELFKSLVSDVKKVSGDFYNHKLFILIYLYNNSFNEKQKKFIQKTIKGNTKITSENSIETLENIYAVFCESMVQDCLAINFKNNIKFENSRFFEGKIERNLSSFFEKEFDESKAKIKTKTFLGIAGLIGLQFISFTNPALIVGKLALCLASGFFVGKLIVENLKNYYILSRAKEELIICNDVSVFKKTINLIKKEFYFLAALKRLKEKPEEFDIVPQEVFEKNILKEKDKMNSYMEKNIYDDFFEKRGKDKKIKM